MNLLFKIATYTLVVLSMPVTFMGQDSSKVTQEEARKMIQEQNTAWGKARVALDKKTFESMMAPDPEFYVELSGGRRLTRQQFLDLITAYPPGVTLARFDAIVLTVEPKGTDWVALILEKLEIGRKDEKGEVHKQYVISITRDGWRKQATGKWVALFSEQIGQQRWRDTPPPIANW
jgi:ketosteroid isomerase-like protein